MFSSPSAASDFVTDSTCLFAAIVKDCLPVVASGVPAVTVIPSPAWIVGPKPVITFLPPSVMLDKSSFARPVAAMVTLPSSLVTLILFPAARFTNLSLGATLAPFTARFHSSAFFANVLSLKVNVTLSPAAAVVM